MPRIPRRPRRAVSVAACLAVTGSLVTGCLVTACSGDPSRATEDYCRTLDAQQDLLVVPIASDADVAGVVGRYLDMSRRAPLAVEEQWRRLAALMQAAATIDASDAEARLRVIEQAYETKRDADAIVAHAASTCGITIDVSGTTTTTTTTTPPTTTPPTTAVAGVDTTTVTVPGALPVDTAVSGTAAPP